MSKYPVLNRKLTNIATFSSFRRQCLTSKMTKNWVDNDNEQPICTGLYFIKHKDFLGEVDIAEYHINKKGKTFWCTPGKPTHWSEIETYEYLLKDGTPLYQEQ